jgi:hypothetical protein
MFCLEQKTCGGENSCSLILPLLWLGFTSVVKLLVLLICNSIVDISILQVIPPSNGAFYAAYSLFFWYWFNGAAYGVEVIGCGVCG